MRHSTKTFYIIISWLLNTTDYTSSGHLSRGTSVSLMYITPMLLYSLIPIDETVLTSTTYCTQVCRTSPSGKEQADPKNACKGHPQSLPVLPNLSPPSPYFFQFLGRSDPSLGPQEWGDSSTIRPAQEIHVSEQGPQVRKSRKSCSFSLNPSPDWPGGSLPVVLGPYPPKVFFSLWSFLPLVSFFSYWISWQFG